MAACIVVKSPLPDWSTVMTSVVLSPRPTCAPAKEGAASRSRKTAQADIGRTTFIWQVLILFLSAPVAATTLPGPLQHHSYRIQPAAFFHQDIRCRTRDRPRQTRFPYQHVTQR